MTRAPDYAIADFNRLKKRELEAMLHRADPTTENAVLTIVQIKLRLNDLRAAYWNSYRATADRRPAKPTQTITAAEVNEFLGSLPPVPLAGET